MRKKILAANWKMNKALQEGVKLAIEIIQELNTLNDGTKLVIICPPFIHLNHIAELLKDKENYKAGAQNCHHEVSGAFTGEVSAKMISSTGVDFVIIGHSERRQYFKETNGQLAKKVLLALENGLEPIFCCGETLKERKANDHKKIVEKQLSESLFHLNENQMRSTVIAYEPVWAIGTGEVASPRQAQEMHQHIREVISQRFGAEIAKEISILYGGSVKPNNAKEIFAQKDVDGGLIGGASLIASDFAAIYEAL